MEQEWTKEQLRLIDAMLDARNHYERLKVQPNASSEDIDYAFKFVRMKFHPDKNKAPRAKEAFQGNSFLYRFLISH